MLTTVIYRSIFEDTTAGQNTACAYAVSGQEELGLEWIGAHNFVIGQLLGYLRVITDVETACECLIDSIQEYLDSEVIPNDLNLDFCMDNVMCIEVVWALNYILQSDLYSEDFFVTRLKNSIEAAVPDMDALLLIKLEALK